MTDKEYTWADLEAAVGQDFSNGERVAAPEPVEFSGIRRICEAFEMGCPLHWDEQVAKAHGYPGLVLPSSTVVVRPTMWKPGYPTAWPDKEVHGLARLPTERAGRPLPAPRTTNTFQTNIETEYLLPVCVGDHLSSGGQKLVSVAVKETSVGLGAFTVSESYIYNQRGEVVAVRRTGGYRYNPHPPEKLEEIWRQRREGRQGIAGSSPAADRERQMPPASQPRSDWSESLHWDEVKEGDAVPAVSLNLTVQRLVMIAGAIRNFDFMHHDTVLARGSGAEEMYLASTGIQAIWERTVREYIGTQGVIRKVGPLRYGIFNEAGFTVTTKGTVKKKDQQDGQNFVELEMWSENDRGVSVGPGPVVVALPRHSGSPPIWPEPR